ncbi:NAD-dependent epimerase/dehydratase family protein [Lichenihabitans sp. Uapishka_5]|uniref:NAD-dependent epimerase/dehydratase family protein n=1 Tax=Lichenihabitans sp. Uapishka_5 TaxID=3037302 RepID=UPI0029E801F6|nr:NAD-dependent epimerase/dehydratase family protein [Lichenihabitans sp. Uapishka_5]MDX7952142.1 NAD-dependent epimerase/dehydratase family protein [Lichenihabitans sp. Uapishka_5]
MNGLTVVFGSGAVGRPIIETLAARGDRVRVAQRGTPESLPVGVEHVACDVLDRDAVTRAVEGAAQIVLAVAFPYDARVWRTAWPQAMANVLAACATSGARLVFIDNLYQLGPQHEPRREDMALSDTGEKPAILATVTRMWMASRDRVRVAALRCPDFYGPGVGHSHLGAFALGELAKGKPAQLLVPPDTPHDFAYVPDIARAAVTLLDAPDDAFGRAWNVPCAPTRSPRELLAIGAATLDQRNRIWAVPLWLMRPLGLVYRMAKEVVDVGFTWDRPYVVDASAFTCRFGFVPTPFAVGMPASARSFVVKEL